MTPKERKELCHALALVIELAEDNALTENEVLYDLSLKAELSRQNKAIALIDKLLTDIRDGKKIG
jgi:hypothetical protein